tara:strand:- start:1060 stop:2661 length:1602 start_codon:yes stop_codon:yes gene_type:complete
MNVIGLYGAIGWDSHSDDGWVHDSGATLFVDGKHICSIQEERLTKYKYDGDFPENSIKYCLSAANLTEDDIDLAVVPLVGAQAFYEEFDNGGIDNYLKTAIFPNAEVEYISHHEAHAYSSIYSWDVNEGCYIVLDGGGSYATVGDTQHFIEQFSFGYFNKEKNIFRNFTADGKYGRYHQIWSHRIYCDKIGKDIDILDHRYAETYSGKVMGLAAYGDKMFHVKDYSFSNVGLPIVEYRTMEAVQFAMDGKRPEDKAAFLQYNIENSVITLIDLLKQRGYLDKNVCLTGGVFLNILANTKIHQRFKDHNFHITPFVNDCGLSYGAAVYGTKNPEIPSNLAFLGKEYDLSNIDLQGLEYDELDYDVVSQYLDDNKIIGWFQGRSEYGPRALGSRSILMSPKYKQNKDILNSRVKHREYWRPFAGVMLKEYLHEYFEEAIDNPYMLYSQTVKEEKKSNLQAIVHEDNTCRIQTIEEGKLATLLKHYNKLSGIPVLLNTSFNDSGKPIIESPEDAIEAFLNMNIDYLVIGNIVVRRK